MKTLKDIYVEIVPGNGMLFAAMFSNADIHPEWIPNRFYADALDRMYVGHSGHKYITDYAEDAMNVYPLYWGTFSRDLAMMFIDKWNRIWEALKTEYNPLENYNMVENENSSGSASGSNSVYAFNSSEQHPADSNSGSSSANRSLTRSGNIGVTTSQMMLQSEIDIRQYNFYLKIFEDIDTILCCSVY